MTAVAELRGVHKSFGRVEALAGIDMAVESGEIVGLLGPNGAGKTTAIALLLGLRRPDLGIARLLGGDPRDRTVRSRCATSCNTRSPAAWP